MTAYLKVWDNYVEFVKLIDRVFDYVNRTFLKQLSSGITIGIVALETFNKFQSAPIKVIFITELLKLFSKYRNNEVVDTDLMGRAIKCFVDQGLKTA